ncbi:probable protein phosphatase 2C 66 [Zingiber officinale]|uniref:probable protein phosphatase 2C 66 n=1 Tax=Zingiber officinale TaxID=94328 RepID=UPI001C4DD4BE|nr:probable protein phosphatase 2C 66 [Zingiber officinale]
MGECLSCCRPPAEVGQTSAASSSRYLGDSANRRSRKKPKQEEGTEVSGGGGRKGRLLEVESVACEFEEDELHRFTGRLFSNGASEMACLHTQQGHKRSNQDAMIVWENFVSRSDTIFCGVFDGHGPFGHLVAQKVRDSLPLKLSNKWSANLIAKVRSKDSEEMTSFNTDEEPDEEPSDSSEVHGDGTVPEMYPPLKKSFLEAFKVVDKDLKDNSAVDCFCSGTTAVTMVKQGQDLVIGNLGDSRAVMGTRDEDNNLIAVQMTVDFKPNLPGEAARIRKCKGRVFALKDKSETARLWLPNKNSPGLAMSRAFGDFCLKDYGLISVPDILYHRLSDKDKFIILASDGVWDVLSNKEAVDIVASAPSRATAARALVDCAVQCWRLKFPTSKIDDCAVVCLFFEKQSSTDQFQKVDSKKTPTHPSESTEGPPDKEATTMLEMDRSVYGTENHNSPLDEIVPVTEEPTKTLAACISTVEDDEWSALEGVTRVNSILDIPRSLNTGKRSTHVAK